MTVKKLINLCPSKKPSKKIIPILQGEHGSHPCGGDYVLGQIKGMGQAAFPCPKTPSETRSSSSTVFTVDLIPLSLGKAGKA